MISLKKSKSEQGFTIVELLIVIVVIGILALLVITTYGGIQSKARNSKRQADVQAMATQIEAYYSQNQHYPSLDDMNSATWRKANMASLDGQALIDPSNPIQNIDGFTAGKVPLVKTPSAAAKSYAYTPTTGGTTPADCGATDDTDCAAYTLTATFEGTVNGATTYAKVNQD